MKEVIAQRWVAAFDLHYPLHDKPTLGALYDYLQFNPVQGFIFGGDQLDNGCISHHSKGKPLYRAPGAYAKDERGFVRDVLEPLEKLLTTAEKVWIIGNHDHWESQLVEEQPELQGVIDRPTSLKLAERGWEVIPLGHHKKVGKLNVCHGEWLTGIGNQAGMYPARKAVETMAANVLAGHTHAPQSFTRIAPVERTQKWQGHIAPALCAVNPAYLRNRPTAWLNGFVIIEVLPGGAFNLYPIIVTRGQFSFGGKVYGRRRAA